MSDHEGVEIQDDGCHKFSHGASSELFRHVWRSYEGMVDPCSTFFMDLAYLAARNLVGGAFLRMSQGRKLSQKWWDGLSYTALEDVSKHFPEGEMDIRLQDLMVWEEAIKNALKQVQYPQKKQGENAARRKALHPHHLNQPPHPQNKWNQMGMLHRWKILPKTIVLQSAQGLGE